MARRNRRRPPETPAPAISKRAPSTSRRQSSHSLLGEVSASYPKYRWHCRRWWHVGRDREDPRRELRGRGRRRTTVFGKRKAWLGPDDAFFGWQLLARGPRRARACARRELGATQLVCFGELFGGGYTPRSPPSPACLRSRPASGTRPNRGGPCSISWWPPATMTTASCWRSPTSERSPRPTRSSLRRSSAAAGLTDDRIAICRADRGPVPVRPATDRGNLREGFVAKPDRRLPYRLASDLKRKLPDFDDARFDAGAAWDPGHLGVGRARRLGRAARRTRRVSRACAHRRSAPNRPQIVDEIVLDVAVDLETVFATAWRALGAEGEARVMAGCPGCSWPRVDDQDERVRRAVPRRSDLRCAARAPRDLPRDTPPGCCPTRDRPSNR